MRRRHSRHFFFFVRFGFPLFMDFFFRPVLVVLSARIPVPTHLSVPVVPAGGLETRVILEMIWFLRQDPH